MNKRLQITIVAAALVSLFAGCFNAEPSDDTRTQSLTVTCSAWGGTYSGLTFTDEQATHAIDMADNATAAELKELRGVGPSIATRIIAARPFGDHADPLAALDAVSWVGTNVLTSFRDQSFQSWCALDDGRQSC